MSGGGGGGKRRGHEEEHEEHENHERWLVSYADMMTLLMVLFIVMFAISQVDAKKFMALKTGLSAGFGAPLSVLDGADQLLNAGGEILNQPVSPAGTAGDANAEVKPSSPQDAAKELQQLAELMNATSKASVSGEVKNLKKAQEELKKALIKAGLANGATFRFDQRGLIVSIATDKVTFASGSASLLPRGKRIIDALAPTLKKLPNHLSIDGHTDSNPIHSAQFASNWYLASSRANGVLTYLAVAHKIPYSRMTASSFADTQPVKEGKSAAAMAANRRVEIVVLAHLDNSAGQAVAELGNATPTPTATSSASTAKATSTPSSTHESSTHESPDSTHDGGTATPTATKSTRTYHNPLGPDPTSASAAHPG